MEISTLSFQHIELIQDDDILSFQFTLNHHVYYLPFHYNAASDSYKPSHIFHLECQGICPLCTRKYTLLGDYTCTVLSMHHQQVFNVLRQHRSIRLPWLFLTSGGN